MTRRLAVLAVTATLLAPTPALAHYDHDRRLERLSFCESTHRWRIYNPPYSGGIQFTSSTWAAYGGRKFGRYAHHATKRQQIKVGRRVAWHGWRGTPPQGGRNAWPHCWPRSAR